MRAKNAAPPDEKSRHPTHSGAEMREVAREEGYLNCWGASTTPQL